MNSYCAPGTVSGTDSVRQCVLESWTPSVPYLDHLTPVESLTIAKRMISVDVESKRKGLVAKGSVGQALSVKSRLGAMLMGITVLPQFPLPGCMAAMAAPPQRTGPRSRTNNIIRPRASSLGLESTWSASESIVLIRLDQCDSVPYGWRPPRATPDPSTYSIRISTLPRALTLIFLCFHAFLSRKRSFIVLRGGAFPRGRRIGSGDYSAVSKDSKL